MKYFIIFLNIIALLSLLAYPGVIIAGIMMFDQPDKVTTTTKLFAAFMVLYPVVVCGLVFLSYYHRSLILAVVATIPTLFLYYTFFYSTDGKRLYESKKPDFVCMGHSGIFINRGMGSLDFVAKYIVYYKHHSVAIFKDSDEVETGAVIWLNDYTLEHYVPRSLVSSCKNSEGKSIFDVYTVSVPGAHKKSAVKEAQDTGDKNIEPVE